MTGGEVYSKEGESDLPALYAQQNKLNKKTSFFLTQSKEQH